jgi:hypothetical protein
MQPEHSVAAGLLEFGTRRPVLGFRFGKNGRELRVASERIEPGVSHERRIAEESVLHRAAQQGGGLLSLPEAGQVSC